MSERTPQLGDQYTLNGAAYAVNFASEGSIRLHLLGTNDALEQERAFSRAEWDELLATGHLIFVTSAVSE